MNIPPTNCHVLSPQAARVLAKYKGVKFGLFTLLSEESLSA